MSRSQAVEARLQTEEVEAQRPRNLAVSEAEEARQARGTIIETRNLVDHEVEAADRERDRA